MSAANVFLKCSLLSLWLLGCSLIVLYILIFFILCFCFVLKDELGGLQYVEMIVIDNLIFGRKWCYRDQ